MEHLIFFVTHCHSTVVRILLANNAKNLVVSTCNNLVWLGENKLLQLTFYTLTSSKL